MEVPVPLREERIIEVPQLQSVPLVRCSALSPWKADVLPENVAEDYNSSMGSTSYEML